MNVKPHGTGPAWMTPAGQAAGLLVFFGILLGPTPDKLPPEAHRLTAVTGLMAVLWLTQAIPIAATSLIPLVAFPLLGIQTADQVSEAYINANVFLYMGGFIIALGIEQWGLHRRMALHIVRAIGSSPRRVVLGFMLATGFLSMWISNTASTLLMMPIGLALLASVGELMPRGHEGSSEPNAERVASPAMPDTMERFATILMIAIAYAASIGGLTTLVGTPTNVQFQQIWREKFPGAPELSAGQWLVNFLPLGLVLMLCAWGLLCWRLPAGLADAKRFNRQFFTQRLRELGPPSRAERMMLVIFVLTAALWIFRKPLRLGSAPILPGWSVWAEQWLIFLGAESTFAARAFHDSTVAIGMALLMFFLPARRNEDGQVEYLMTWTTAEKLPWGILLLFGGGFAIASAFDQTGLSKWVGEWFADIVRNWPVWLIVLSACLLMTFLTEFTSNVATISALLPILAGAALSIQVDPRLLLFPAAISTSCAFMLPIATPPNAIVFGSGRIRMGDMVRAGLLLNLIGSLLITLAAFVLLMPQLDISLHSMPDWAQPGE